MHSYLHTRSKMIYKSNTRVHSRYRRVRIRDKSVYKRANMVQGRSDRVYKRVNMMHAYVKCKHEHVTVAYTRFNTGTCHI